MLTLALSLALQTAPAPGKIVFYRTATIVGAAVGCPIRHEGKEVVELGRGKYAEWEVPAGRYVLLNKSSSLEVSVNPGETRYVRCNMRNGAELQFSDEATFKDVASKYERKELTQE